ncbi:MAG: type III pantothenate kinase, partial [Acinetobacter sp.]
MKKLWLDIGNTRLKYWITEHDQIIEQAAELHLQSPADLLLGLIQHFKALGLHQVGLSSVQDKINNERILSILESLHIPVIFAQVQAEYAGLICGYDEPSQLGIDRWLQVLAVATQAHENYCVISCGTALTIDLAQGQQHLGGFILPNLYLQRDSLIQNTKGIK